MHKVIVSIVIVHYKANDLIQRSIRSINECVPAGLNVEIVVIDNSGDFIMPATVDGLNIIYYNMGYNSGFARAVNMGIACSSGKYIMLLNQDTKVQTRDIISRFIGVVAANNDRLVVGCRLVNGEGGYQQSIWLDYPSLTSVYRNSAINYKLHPSWKKDRDTIIANRHRESGVVPRINAACLFFRKPKNVDVIYFDEEYFLYGEDVEWAYRLRKGGFTFYHIHDVLIEHIGSASSPDASRKSMQIQISEWMTVGKIHGKRYLIVYLMAELIFLLLDLLLVFLYNLRHAKISSHKLHIQVNRLKAHLVLMRDYLGIIFLQSKLMATDKQYLKLSSYDTAST
jgi:GT2 family glycosyltransferase